MVKKALLVGICYKGTPNELNGCINDVTEMRDLLINAFGYHPDNINLLTDDTQIKPTKTNILQAMKHLVRGASTKDVLCMCFSGHGTQFADKSRDESQGFDDAIYTLDDDVIIDDDLLSVITNLNGAHISMFFDCCHSGTMGDLPYNLRYNGITIGNKPQFQLWTEKSKPINGTACMFAGCLDTQTSADSQFKRTNNEYVSNGAFTYMLLQAVKQYNGKNPTNRNVLIDVYNKLSQDGYDQIPQFSCSKMRFFDAPFTL